MHFISLVAPNPAFIRQTSLNQEREGRISGANQSALLIIDRVSVSSEEINLAFIYNIVAPILFPKETEKGKVFPFQYKTGQILKVSIERKSRQFPPTLIKRSHNYLKSQRL